MLIPEWTSVAVPVIGMLHAPALPGSAGFQDDFEATQTKVLQDAQTLCDGGVDGLMLENYGDVPFFPDRVPAITVAAMTVLATRVRQRFPVPLGINMLRNDGRSALAVAAACGASLIRVNILCGARLTDQGLIQGIAHDLLRDRTSLRCTDVRILADVNVKHSAPLAAEPLAVEVRNTVERGRADAIIVSGEATGSATDIREVCTAKLAAPSTPVLVGSGVAVDNVAELIRAGANGLIVGSSLKRDGHVGNPVDKLRVQQLIDEVRRASRT